MVGMMGEMGPVGTPKFRPGIPSPNPAPLVENDYAWTKKTAMLFVEQPVSTLSSKDSVLKGNMCDG
jgi:carboxypeptidase C (cathepsin A)